MLLVGSKALEFHVPLNRILHDWDVWMTETEFCDFLNKNQEFLVKTTPSSTLFDIKGTVVEVKHEKQFEPTDRQIFDMKHTNRWKTPFGEMAVPDFQTIYDMKCSTLLCIPEWKHQYDKDLMEKMTGCCDLQQDTQLFKDRLAETQTRVAKSKKNLYGFFHKSAHKEQKISTIPEYIVHDKLHEMIADLIDLNIPTYIKTINGDYETDMEMFHKLPHELKVSLMAEESLVLALERWFIPQMVENGINARLIPKFYNNNEAGPTYALLKHVNIKGLIGEEAEIVQFGRDNFAEIEKAWVAMKEKIHKAGGFPQWFYDEIFAVREKYRKGEKVGIHHV